MTEGAHSAQYFALTNEQRVEMIDRLVKQCALDYRNWSRSAKRGYRWLNAATIAFSAAVPVVVLIAPLLSLSTQTPWVPALAGIFGACATLAKSVDSLLKNHETWLRNDAALNNISTEQTLFRVRAGVYGEPDVEKRVALYATRVEALVGAQVAQWTGAETAAQGHGA